MTALRWLSTYDGRLNRAAFLGHLFAVGLLALVIAGFFVGLVWFWPGHIDLLVGNWIVILITAPLYGSGLVRRLHDLGLSGRWAVAFAVLLPTHLLSDLRPFGLSTDATIGLEMIVAMPLAAGLLVLLFRKGQPQANRFGPPPA